MANANYCASISEIVGHELFNWGINCRQFFFHSSVCVWKVDLLTYREIGCKRQRWIIEFQKCVISHMVGQLHLWADSFKNVLQYDANGRIYIVVDGGLYRGCCGAPYISHSDQVVAMHLSSGRNISLVKKRSRKEQRSSSTAATTQSEKPSTMNDIIDSVSDVSNVHSSVREGLCCADYLRYCESSPLLHNASVRNTARWLLQ